MIWHQYFSVLFILSTAQWKMLDACSCMPRHPQQHYCKSDFVILATPRIFDEESTAYKLKIRKEFKMTEKAKVALKSGRLVTYPEESLCGATNLMLNQTYIIMGVIENLEAKINLCNYVKRWTTITRRQRKGFKMLYRQGCECKIKQSKSLNVKMTHTCQWLWKTKECHFNYGICLTKKNGKCDWAMARNLKTCLQKHNLTTSIEPPSRRYQR